MERIHNLYNFFQNIVPIKQRNYWVGMTEEMARMSLGNPNDINRSVGVWGVHEQWVYEVGINLYFENGRLESYQN